MSATRRAARGSGNVCVGGVYLRGVAAGAVDEQLFFYIINQHFSIGNQDSSIGNQDSSIGNRDSSIEILTAASPRRCDSVEHKQTSQI